MVLAPVVGALLAVPGSAVLWVLGQSRVDDPSFVGGAGPALAAALVVGLLTFLTRAMHLDGLADTADGLGSGKAAPEALEVMRRGDVGPFGVVTLVLVLLVQVLALAQLVERGLGPAALLLALVVSRLVLPLVCLRGSRPARADGLGSTVVGSVAPGQLAVSVVLTLAVLLPVALIGSSGTDPWLVARAGVAVALGLAAAPLVAWWATRRLGGLTGDVLGACVETSSTTVLVALALVA
jgi:adenosylcobinamide-GDP ribazoletransferase